MCVCGYWLGNQNTQGRKRLEVPDQRARVRRLERVEDERGGALQVPRFGRLPTDPVPDRELLLPAIQPGRGGQIAMVIPAQTTGFIPHAVQHS
jgi:hypothetical protein